MILKKLLLSVFTMLFMTLGTMANDCPKWLPMPYDDLVVVIPIYDETITEPDMDCDEIIDTLDPDIDGDGIANTTEIANGTNPNLSDTDGDGVSDNNDAFPTNAAETSDTDGDGIGNNADLDDDNDGYSDIEEIAAGSNPLDESSIPLYITALDFTMTLDINASTVLADWLSVSMASQIDGNGLTASVKTQGAYGTFVVTGTSLAYLKTVETNNTDSGVLEITDGTDTIEITVTLNSLYWKMISAGDSHTVAIKSDGTLWAWGYNFNGQLGDGTTINKWNPVQESSHSSNWSSINAGIYHTVAIKNDGTLWAWGRNNYGQLGNGTIINKSIPTQESSTATTWSNVSAGTYHTIAIKSDGTLWAWGYNFYGQLGDGMTINRNTPTQESSAATTWSSVSAGQYHTVAIKSDGTLWAWGRNTYGELGDGTTTQSTTATQESSATSNWSSVSAGRSHTVAIKNNGTLWAWGRNSFGQLGDGTITNKSIPTQESSASNNWNSVGAGSSHTVAQKTNKTLWAWGRNNHGQLGDGTTTQSTIPIQESNAATTWNSVSVGNSHAVAIKSDGTLWAWGYNFNGQLGDGTSTNRNTPTQESSAATTWSSVSGGGSHTVAIKSDGTLWAWGRNNYGQLGDGTTTNRTTPTQESSASNNWNSVHGRLYHTVAIKSNGTLWSWGRNSFGQLGDGTTTNRTTPTQESSAATTWNSVSGGAYHTVAIKSDGTLWAWGYNSLGQLGDGTITQRITPTQESSAATTWSSVSGGQYHTIAIKSNGTLWSWGRNNFGQLGDGTTTNRTTPTQESSAATTWISMSGGGSHTVAIKSDGTLWAWGYNIYGQLGNGTTTQSTTPIQESSAATIWSSVSAGDLQTIAIKSDGTLWAWGYNNGGRLGDGTNTSRSIPTQESSAATTWSSMSTGIYHTLAIKSNGTLWAWGNSEYGKITDVLILDPKLSIERNP